MAQLTINQIRTIQRNARDLARHRVVTGKVLRTLYFTVEERNGAWHIRGIANDKVHECTRNFFFSRRTSKLAAEQQCNAANLRLSAELAEYTSDFKTYYAANR